MEINSMGRLIAAAALLFVTAVTAAQGPADTAAPGRVKDAGSAAELIAALEALSKSPLMSTATAQHGMPMRLVQMPAFEVAVPEPFLTRAPAPIGQDATGAHGAFFDFPTSGIIFFAGVSTIPPPDFTGGTTPTAQLIPAPAVLPDDATEILGHDETTLGPEGSPPGLHAARHLDIAARDKSYYRIVTVKPLTDPPGTVTFAIQYPDERTYARIRTAYQEFRKSFRRR